MVPYLHRPDYVQYSKAVRFAQRKPHRFDSELCFLARALSFHLHTWDRHPALQPAEQPGEQKNNRQVHDGYGGVHPNGIV